MKVLLRFIEGPVRLYMTGEKVNRYKIDYMGATSLYWETISVPTDVSLPKDGYLVFEEERREN